MFATKVMPLYLMNIMSIYSFFCGTIFSIHTLYQIVGEELGVLPGMDSIFLALSLERLVGFLGITAQTNKPKKFDIVIYDGISTEETLRMIGATSKARFEIYLPLLMCTQNTHSLCCSLLNVLTLRLQTILEILAQLG